MVNHIPNKRLTRRGYNKSKSICDGCKKDLRVRNLVLFKGKYLCRNCRNKEESFKIQSSASQIGRGHISIKEALKKSYEVKVHKSGCTLSLPLCFSERRVKMILIDKKLNTTANKPKTN